MSEEQNNDHLKFDLPKNQSSVIKVIGVGGGGSNAVNHMFSLGIKGVDFVISNTDAQALENSPVPNKIQLGVTLTEGLGAGANPDIGEQAAQESIQEVKDLLGSNTKMVFITAGMGGGTGTGAAPIIAKVARDMGILTVGIVTMPFIFEGSTRKQQAEKGVDNLRKCVDSLVVINNNKLREVYGNLGFKAGFAKADEVLATAARGIAEVITHHYTANIDLRDAKTVLANSGTAIMGAAQASGDNRAAQAITAALDSPLLNDNHIRGAKNVLLLIVSGEEEITIDEIGEINDHIQNEAGGSANIIMGIGENPELGDEIAVTIVATGFNPDQQETTIGRQPDKVVHILDDEQPVSTNVYDKPLTLDEEDDDKLLDSELQKADERQETNQAQPQLFELEEEEPPHPTAGPVEAPEQAPESPEAARDKDDSAETAPPEEEPQAEEMVFEIRSSEEEQETPQNSASDMTDSHSDEEKASPQGSKNEEEPPVRKFTLEDYHELEESLKQAKPEDEMRSPQRQEEQEEEEELHFEVKTKGEQSSQPRPQNSNVDPMESTIEESMKLRAEERRAKLKAFNYRFKNFPNGITEADQEPAYKRHGVDIDTEKRSSQQGHGRYSVNDGESGSDIRSNNSFLHDNVD